jgi:deazaflavin-dependent oxidoreductase (nitroreductase family)
MTPPRPVVRLFWSLHRALRRLSGGRLGTSLSRGGRIGTLFLHTQGRKSGQPRVNGLFYLFDGPDVVVVASNAGADSDPAWWRRPVRARLATAEEDARLWPGLVAGNPDFAAYRAKAARPIPVVILQPRQAPSQA